MANKSVSICRNDEITISFSIRLYIISSKLFAYYYGVKKH